jgi:hypothetical protein
MEKLQILPYSFHGRNPLANNSKINYNLTKTETHTHINLEFESKKISNDPHDFLALNSMGIMKIMRKC